MTGTAARTALLTRRIKMLVAATNRLQRGRGGRRAERGRTRVVVGVDRVRSRFRDRSVLGAAVAWQFSGGNPESREKVALRIIAFSFFALALYVTVDAVLALGGVGEAEHSPVGIGLAAVSLAVMPVLSWAQRRAGRELGSRSAVADSKQTLLCTYLSAALLAGLILNAALGWSWADPVAALVIAAVAVREGRQALRGDTCCAGEESR